MGLIIMDNPDPIYITLRDLHSLSEHSSKFLSADSRGNPNEDPSDSSEMAEISDHANNNHSDHDSDSDDDGNRMLR